MSKILIIEDEEKIARFVELELSHEGYETDKATNGREGLEKIESGGYDLVILDIMLPELNGIEVLRRARRTTDVPVILLTARDSVTDKVSGLDMGANDYITKPFARGGAACKDTRYSPLKRKGGGKGSRTRGKGRRRKHTLLLRRGDEHGLARGDVQRAAC